MRKSSEVPLTLLAAVALASIGCSDEPRHCVDAQNHLMSDSACEQKQNTPTGAHGFHFVSGGSSGGHIGDTVVGASESGISRGGFGSSSGGDDAGSGHGGGDAGE
jgi:hypothetical protein